MSNEVKVGLAVLASIAVLYVSVRFLGGQPLFGAGYDLVVAFDDAQGLAPGSLVRLNGVRVGDVRGLELSPDARRVFVTARIDAGTEIPRGSTVQTSGISALGTVNIEITPPVGADAGRPIAAGDTLVASTLPDLFDLLAGQSNSITVRADSALIGAVSTFTTLDRLLTNSGDDLTAVLAQLRFLTTAATTTLLEERARIGRALGSFELAAANAGATTEAVANDVRDLSTAVGNDVVATSRSIRGVAETNADSIAVVVAGLNTSLRRLDANLASLNRVTARLDTTLSRVESSEGTLGLLLTDPSLYENANAAAATLQQVLQDFQNDPSRYLRDLNLVRVF